MWDEPLNTTIDEVARQMTEGAPGDGAAFRRRVIARIRNGESPRRRWRVSFVLTAIAAAAAIVVALFVAREPRPGPLGPGGTAVPVSQTPPLPVANPAANGTALQVTAHATPDPIVRSPRASSPGVVKTTPALEPNTVASIAVAPLAVDTLTPESLHLEQLETIAPITVAPIDIPDAPRRNQ